MTTTEYGVPWTMPETGRPMHRVLPIGKLDDQVVPSPTFTPIQAA
ncbi:hypothetical protein [Jiella sp. M17.18]